MIKNTEWRKARRSGAQGDCVEVRGHDGAVEVRDSKDPHGPVLRFTESEWGAFLNGMENREFHDLIG
jgi:hypothetical protein